MANGSPALILLDLGSPRLDLVARVLVPVGPWSVLEHAIRRLRVSGLPLVVAFSDEAWDVTAAAEASRLGACVERRTEPDALARAVAIGRDRGVTEVVSVEPGSVFIDVGGPARTLGFRRRVGADLVTECGLPTGTAVEAVSLDALERADAIAVDPYDREHVTSLLRRDRRFRALRAVAPGPLRRPGLQLTAETPERLEFLREVYATAASPSGVTELTDIIRAADARIIQQFGEQRQKRGA